MKSVAVASALLLATLGALAIVPTASAGTYCYYEGGFAYCCIYTDPSGNPGSAEYAATSIVSAAHYFACVQPGSAYHSVLVLQNAVWEIYDCVVNSNC